MGAAGKNVVPHNRTQPHRTNEADRHEILKAIWRLRNGISS